MQKKKDFVSIRDIMKTVLRNMQQQQSDKRKEVELVWNQVVGDEFASLTSVRKVTRTEVHIEVYGSSVLAEVKQFYLAAFFQQLEENGIFSIEKVNFKIAD